ncbi:hypothetical protein [Nostoc sp. LEGE 12450]|nr:hypothetical protein [Nostoc sp. LEGE 12450]MBE8992757.1 hypothetical protein [Nostoc sp. LEGE 12450]
MPTYDRAELERYRRSYRVIDDIELDRRLLVELVPGGNRIIYTYPIP